MSRASRTWFSVLCFASVILILFWAGVGERGRNSLDSTQFRVARNNLITSKVSTDTTYSNGLNKGGVAAMGVGSELLPSVLSRTGRLGLLSTRHSDGQDRTPGPGQGRKRRARVLLMSYMRSGSTFTGDIFQSNPGVFYVYEPLLYVNDDDYMTKGKRSVRSRLIAKAMGIPSPPEIHNYTLDTLSCKLTDHYLRFLYGLTYSKSTTEFHECQKKLGIKPSTFGECGEQLRSRCEHSEAVVTKILRLKMWEVEELLSVDPDLRVIHLVRDPRGVSVSRRAVRYYFVNAPFCARLNADAEMSAKLQLKYPDRILTSRYEDLASNASQVARIMFEFAGISWSEEVEARLNNMTSNSDIHSREHVFNTNRKNSSLTASNWRQKISFSTAQDLQRLCHPSMELYGYVPFKTVEELRDLNIASFQQSYSDQFYKAQVLR